MISVHKVISTGETHENS